MAINKYLWEHLIFTQSKLSKWLAFGMEREIQRIFLSTFTIHTNMTVCPTLASRKEEMIPNGRMSSASISRDIGKLKHCVSVHAHDCELFQKLLMLPTDNNVSHQCMHCLEGNTNKYFELRNWWGCPSTLATCYLQSQVRTRQHFGTMQPHMPIQKV